MVERMVAPEAAKLHRLKKTRGIKCLISTSTLHHILTGAKRWYAFSKISDGADVAERSALAGAIPVAEAILKKYEARNKAAFERREEWRDNAAWNAPEGEDGNLAEWQARVLHTPSKRPSGASLAEVAHIQHSKRPTRW